jgi:hypothetical protein
MKRRTLIPVRTRAAVMARAGNACEKCSAANRLHVHHRNEDPTDHAESNLQVLCPGCHRKAHVAEGYAILDRRVADSLNSLLSQRGLRVIDFSRLRGVYGPSLSAVLRGRRAAPPDFEERFLAAVQVVAAEKAAKLMGEPVGVR